MSYPVTALTTPNRYADRATYEKSVAHALLDEAYVCHVGFVVDGAPRILPTLYVRDGDRIYLHGSTAATPWLAARRADEDGLPIVFAVTIVDALVLARAQMHHSANYRSLIAHGVARLITDEPTKRAAMSALIDKVGRTLLGLGADDPATADQLRSTHTRPPDAAELAKTAVLALDLDQVSVKRRMHGVVDDDEDLALPHWAGIIPLTVTAGAGIADSGVTVSPPVYVPAQTPWRQPPTLRGAHVAIEPLDLAHAEELFAALRDAEVWEHNPARQPANAAEHAEIIAAGLADPHRVPLLIRDAVTGEAIGTSSYYGMNEANETVAIGYTQFARARWRTAANTESKLLMMAHAFETLGAGRVEWHTDVRNTRSQAAIERLGATREGILRRHRRRGDGTWRDTVQYAMTVEEWPTARNRLAARLAAGNTV